MFFEQKFIEKLMVLCQLFDFQVRVFAISAHFFKSNLHRGQPLAKFPPGDSIWHVCKPFWFSSYFEKVLIHHYFFTIYIDRSFVLIVTRVKLPHNGLANKRKHSRKQAAICCGVYVGFLA